MSYTVLARKWRPKRFSELVGQQHAKTTLVNALDQGRLHHAYLFTGTRGVGKTSIARIFAKSLNCESGTSADPCGTCSVCSAIDAGNYVDLIEIDAASRTRVEDTREILDNVPYAPTQGRYKVYLIDEVHMLSKHSFNALLKTLEEPPEHVKFLLATTDPQKLPITILSRCLQFNLKALSRSEISQQLAHVLTQEGIRFDDDAIALLAKAANGSMRDSLSLTDQAVASSQGTLTLAIVQEMLGTIDKQFSRRLLTAVLSGDAQQAFAVVNEIAEFAPDYKLFTDDLLSVLHLAAMSQLISNVAKLSADEATFVKQLAAQLNPQDIQLLYQVVLHGKRDLMLAPEPMIGFEMLVMRLLAFSPLGPVTPIKQDIPADTGAKKLGFSESSSVSPALDSAQTTPSAAANAEFSQPEQAEVENPFADFASAPQTNSDEMDCIEDDDELSALAAQQADILAQAEVVRQDHSVAYEEEAEVSSDDSMPASNLNDASNQDNQDSPNPLTAIDAILQRRGKATATIPREQTAENSIDDNQQEPSEARHSLQTEPTGEEPSFENQPSSDASVFSETLSVEQDSNQALADVVDDSRLMSAPAQDSETVNDSDFSAKVPAEAPSSTADSMQAKDKKAVSKIVDFQERLQQRGISTTESTQVQDTAPEVVPSAEISEENKPRYAYLECEVESLDNSEIEQSLSEEEQQQVDQVLGPRSAADIDLWSGYIKQMKLTGLARQLVLNATFTQEGEQAQLSVDRRHQHLDKPAVRELIESTLISLLDGVSSVTVQFVDDPGKTPMRIQNELNQQRLANALELAKNDANIQAFEEKFEGFLDENSVLPR